MFNPSPRTKLLTGLIGFAALAIASAGATPASAAKWTQANSVESVCKRTNCYMDTTANGAVTFGCGVGDGKGHNCFICDNKKGKCYGVRPSDVEGKRGRNGVVANVGNTSSVSHTWSKPTVNRVETAPVKFGSAVSNSSTTRTRMGGRH
ncbi:MAG: hypothetical protein ACTHLO_01985 [Pseudolabrys sp.]